MKFLFVRFGLAQSLVALVVSFALLLSAPVLALGSPAKSSSPVKSRTSQPDSSQSELKLTSAKATAITGGVLLQWSTNPTPDNIGFNVYRVKDGQSTRVNREIIPGALFGPGPPALMRGGYSYSWFDRGGTANSVYVIESVSADGSAKTLQQLMSVAGKSAAGFEEFPGSSSDTSPTETTNSFEKYFPAAEDLINSPQGTIQEQWAIAAQTGLKIGIKKDGWYRVTQQQMVAAGFNPTVDIRNLRLFVDANEVAIGTNQLIGRFSSGDYIEFYGRGLDTPTTDTRVYYLIAGTTPGKRITGDIQLDSPPVEPPSPPAVLPVTEPVLRDPIFYSYRVNLSWLMNTEETNRISDAKSQEARGPTVSLDRPTPLDPSAQQAIPDNSQSDETQVAASYPLSEKQVEGKPRQVDSLQKQKATPAASAVLSAPMRPKVTAPAPQAIQNKGVRVRKRAVSRKQMKRKVRRQFRKEHSHALAADGFAVTNFDYTVQRKDRGVYFSSLINGDEENWFGQVIATNPSTQTINSPNPDPAAAGPAKLEIKLQGVNVVTHQLSVKLNNVVVGSFNFFGENSATQILNVPISLLQNGANALTFTPQTCVPACPDTTIVDYVRLTYPHLFRADSGSLKFNLRGSQTRTVDGFSTPSVRLIDYTNPLAVKITRPSSAPSGAGYAITVPLSENQSKDQRLLLAIPEGQFDQPASLTVNEPSTLNLNSNVASFVIISRKDLLPSFTTNVSPINTSLVAQRQAQGHTVSLIDIDNVYDEFGFGVHGPQAVKDFLRHANTHWSTPPQYVIFAGDASIDPRNYTGNGNWDLVPTKLVDATYNETSADDWLTDFDDDGIANIPVGRLPFRTLADANLVVSKIVNFTPVNPQSAMLVADDPTGYYFNFEVANDQVQALLPPSMVVQRVNVRTDATANTSVVNGFNQGKALVNYTGHGNVDTWGSSSIFTASQATALGNSNQLSFVVVMDCLNGYYQDPTVLSLAEALLKAPGGGAVATFASSGLTLPDGQHAMGQQLYTLLYGAQPISLGDAIKSAKSFTGDIDVRRTWIFFGDPSMKIR